MDTIGRWIAAVCSVNYDPLNARFFMSESQPVHVRLWSDGEYTNIYYFGETFSMRANWLVAWVVFRIVRKIWKNRSIV